MDSDLLRTFLTVQRTRHFAQAAEQLYLTPSAVSFRIRQLEAELGVSLFHRRRSNIQLTAAGERLVAHAEALLAAWQQARQAVGGVAASHWRLSLVAPPFWPQLLVGSGSDLLALAQQQSLTIDWLPPQPAAQRALREGRVDLVITADAEDDAGLTALPLARLDWQWYGQHVNLPHIYIAGAMSAWLPADRHACGWRGLPLSATLALVAAGKAAALLPTALAAAEMASLQLLQLPGESQQWRALWRSDHEQAAWLATAADLLRPVDF